MQNDTILDTLYRVIQERKTASADTSYTASLLSKGIDKILKKVGEESAELIIAGKGGVRQEIVCETADLLFHTLVLLGFYDIPPEEIYAELRRRFGTSGIAEKKSRGAQNS
jgi:phosphoribosyl-ATP pyrophosphohydrolase